MARAHHRSIAARRSRNERKRESLWKLTVSVSSEPEDAVTELLSGIFGQTPSSYTPVDAGQSRLAVYFRRKSDWSPAKQSLVQAGLDRLKLCGLDLGKVSVSFSKVPTQDWSESWKRHFKPLEISPSLLVKPSWSKRSPRQGQAVVVLDPGLSFGTGQHPTTSFCLREIVAQRLHGTKQSLLDIGTGSGILAIAAAKLGYDGIEAFDIDADAVRIARENGRQNGIGRRIRFSVADASRLNRRSPQKYSIVCANVSSDLLLAQPLRIIAQLAPGGLLILAGVLKKEFVAVRQAYEQAGLHLVRARTEKEWRSGSFK